MSTQSFQTGGRKGWLILGATVLVGCLSLLVFAGIGDNLVYYWSPAELIEKGDAARGATVRLGGMVAADSVAYDIDQNILTFGVTDGIGTVSVRADELPPQMFREGVGVVVEGELADDGHFEAHQLMISHDNEYAPPEDGEYDMNELGQTVSEASL